jgi:signal transduction histidine kinase/CheY-like chemotaxis protein
MTAGEIEPEARAVAGGKPVKLFGFVGLPIVAGILVLGAVAVLLTLAAAYRTQSGWVQHTYEVERELARLMSTVKDAELGQRGYLLTGEETFLAQYERARADVPGEIDRLAALTSDNPAQREAIGSLRQLAQRRLDIIAQTLTLHRRGDRAGAVALMRSGPGRPTMEALRVVVDEMESREAALLASRRARAQSTSTWLFATGAVALVLAVLAGMLWQRNQQSLTRALRQSLTSAQTALSELRASRDEVALEAAARDSAERQVRQLQKMEAIGQLTGGVAHDFNNMLAVIMSAITLVKKRIKSGSGDVEGLLDGAYDGAERAARLTQRLLAFSRQQPLDPQAINPNTFVSGMTDLLVRTLGETIVVETVLGGGLWRTHADASQLENAILNLAVNARDAMPEGGKLTLETANVDLDDAYARANIDVKPGQYVMIAVTDTGCGMTAEVIERAFDPFYTTKPTGAGTGLGLSQVFGFVKQSGGNVKIYSEDGRGTSVKVYLPRYFGAEDEERRPAAPAPEIFQAPDGAGAILLVEDEPRLREVTAAGLRDLGYVVIEARGGAEALALLDAHPEIGCLFTDIVMPEMTGRQLADEAKRRRENLSVLYTTGYTRNAVVHNGVLDPGVNFIAKPFTIDNLARKLREVIAS